MLFPKVRNAKGQPHPARQTALWVANVVSMTLPQTRCFGLRAALFKVGGVRIGRGVRISGTARIPYGNVEIGANSWIGPGTHLIAANGAPIRIGSNCDLAPEVMLVVGSHDIGDHSRRAGLGTATSIEIGDGCWLGARTMVLGGSTMRAGSVAAAGALIVDDVAQDTLVLGVPARPVKALD